MLKKPSLRSITRTIQGSLPTLFDLLVFAHETYGHAQFGQPGLSDVKSLQ